MPELFTTNTPAEPQQTTQPAEAAVTDPAELISSEAINTPVPATHIGAEYIAQGMTQEELKDPNNIKVTVADYKAPLVVLFGPPACGKTMTLIRLTRYLNRQGYSVAPIRSFRPDFDTNYRYICDHFNEMINDNNAAQSTDRISFMLVSVSFRGRCLCQILEAPGEYYFDPQHPNAPFPYYVNSIIASSNRKIWAFMIEPDWKSDGDRRNYVSRIHQLKRELKPQDKVMFIFNKIDKTNFVYAPGKINQAEALRHINYLYPNIYEPFRNQNPLTSWFSPYRFSFIPFQTGYYSQTANGTLTFQEGHNEYPKQLWASILSKIRG